MALGGLLGQEQLGPDLAVGATGGHELGDLALAAAQGVKALAGAPALARWHAVAEAVELARGFVAVAGSR